MIEGLPYGVVNKVPFTRWEGLEGSHLYLVNTKHEWDAFYELLMKQKLVGVDTETSGFDWFGDAHIVGMSFGWADQHFYIPVRHEASLLGGEQPPQLRMEDILDDLKAFFARTDVLLALHNCSFDRHFFHKEGIEFHAPFVDTLNYWQFYDENAPGKLKSIAAGWTDMQGKKHKGIIGPQANAKEKEIDNWRGAEAKARRDFYSKLVMDTADELRFDLAHQDKSRVVLKQWIAQNLYANHPYKGAQKDDIHYGLVPIPLMVEYAATDTYITLRLYQFLKDNVRLEGNVKDLFENEMKLTSTLFWAEHRGVRIDMEYLAVLEKELTEEIDQLERKVYGVLGPINLGSTQQLAEALQKQGVTLTQKTKTGWKLDSDILEEIAKEHSVAADIVKLRKTEKLKETYVSNIRARVTGDDILHCSFNQNVTTGRMSSRNPNLQNVPRSDNRIRKAFLNKSPEYIYILADYSQVELRLTAHFSKDPLLLDAYSKDQDVHTRTMCEMFGYDYGEIVSILRQADHPRLKEFEELRSIAKIINFSIVYGTSAVGLAGQIPRPARYADLSDAEWIAVCEEYINTYFNKYIGVKRMINRASRLVKEQAYITNWFGRVRHLPGAHAWKSVPRSDEKASKEAFKLLSRCQRQGTNFLVQSTAADVFKIAVVRLHKLFEGTKSYLVNFVHDEVQVYLHKDDIHLLGPMRRAMEDFDFVVPLKVDVSYSLTNWADKKKLG